MITRKSKSKPTTQIWPYTPDPSPPLEATEIHIAIENDLKMASDHPHSRPISVTLKRDAGIHSPNWRPTLDDVLNNRAPAPYTLAAYTAFLSQQHCLETLEFVTEARRYATKYDEACVHFCGMPLTTDTDEGFELKQDWERIMDIYVKPGAPREINLPSEERDDLVDVPYDPKPPRPEFLDPAVQRMRDLMSDSIFIPFCNSVKQVSHAQTFNALSQFQDENPRDNAPSTYDDRKWSSRPQPARRRSPPTSSGFQPSRSPPQTSNRNSALTSGLSRTSNPRLSSHISHSSAASESAVTDDSGSGGSPSAGDLESNLSPPLTPPTSELPPPHLSSTLSGINHPKPLRSESGGWKRMGMKIFGQKKKGPYGEREDQ